MIPHQMYIMYNTHAFEATASLHTHMELEVVEGVLHEEDIDVCVEHVVAQAQRVKNHERADVHFAQEIL